MIKSLMTKVSDLLGTIEKNVTFPYNQHSNEVKFLII